MAKKYRRRKGKSSAKKLALTALKKVNKIESQIERKHLDVVSNDNVVDTAGVAVCLNDLDISAYGDGRIGEVVGNERLRINMIIENNHGTPEDVMLRLVVLRFKDQEGASTVVWTDVFKSIVAGGTTHGGVLAHRFLDSKNTYAVMYDNTFYMDTSLNSGIPLKMSFKLNHNTQYKKVPAGTVADIIKNGLWILAISEQETSANAPYMSFHARLTYNDS